MPATILPLQSFKHLISSHSCLLPSLTTTITATDTRLLRSLMHLFNQGGLVSRVPKFDTDLASPSFTLLLKPTLCNNFPSTFVHAQPNTSTYIENVNCQRGVLSSVWFWTHPQRVQITHSHLSQLCRVGELVIYD